MSAPFACKVKFTYYKASGKYYSEGFLEVLSTDKWYDIMTKARNRDFKDGMPGLVTKAEDFFFTIESDDHPEAFPALYHPSR